MLVTGDWDDVGAALAIGLGKANLSVVESRADADRTIHLDLVDVLDRPVTLWVRPRDAGQIEIRARFGRFGDPRREEALVVAVAQRLHELAGVDVAPAH